MAAWASRSWARLAAVPARDILLDRPSWAPAWFPSVDDMRQMRIMRWVLGLVFVAGLAACVTRGADNPADPILGEVRVVGDLAGDFGSVLVDLVSATSGAIRLCLLDAETTEERSRGLKGVTDLQGYDGMLFRNDSEVQTQFVMVDTVMPLSITWWGVDGSFVSSTDMEPCTEADPGACARYSAAGPYKWAIEVPQGALADLDLGEGATIAVGEIGCVPGG